MPKKGENVALRFSEDMWIVDIGSDGMVKCRDEEGFTLLVKVDTLGWDESRGMWAYIDTIEGGMWAYIDTIEGGVVNVEGDPTRNGAFGRGGRA